MKVWHCFLLSHVHILCVFLPDLLASSKTDFASENNEHTLLEIIICIFHVGHLFQSVPKPDA